ncbi:beta-amyrin 28-monooxygenase [Quercus suber]|uniref:Beta-amyrin 28-monooxygenase n=1 Tax=Quercus suber TaxID=58331 RepID=A0AAW0JPJ7_QUESU
MDIQNDALENTSSLIEDSLNPHKVPLSHSNVENYTTALYQEPQRMHLNKAKIDDLGAFRLVVFNLGCLPGGDKNILTKPEIILLAQLPPGEKGWPIIGETLEFARIGQKGTPKMFVKDKMRKYSQDLYKTSMFRENMVVCCGASGHKFLFSNEKKCVPHSVDQVVLSPKSIENFVPEDSIKVNFCELNLLFAVGMEDVLTRYVFGRKKTTEFGYLVKKHVVQKGDTVIDATCGNGYDTLVMVNMLADELARVNDALQNTSSLLEELLNPNEVPFPHSSIYYFNYKGDTVIDATCGNGYDTLVMVNMLADELARVNDALQNTSSLLEELLNPNEVWKVQNIGSL